MFGLTTTRRLNAELAAAKADTNRWRENAEHHKTQATRWRASALIAARRYNEADAANRRLEGRVLELGRRLAALAESDPAHLATLEARLDRALTACSRYLAALWAEKQRADQLETSTSADNLKAITEWEQRAKTCEAWLPSRDLEARPVDGASARPLHPAIELRRTRDRCRALEARLSDVEGRKRGVAL